MLNYKHLHYFWMVARHGGIARASERLHITPQTISGQISLLEEQLGESLFSKAGRKLELTQAGRLVLSYADEIFSLGNELRESLRNLPADRPMIFKIGVADVVPKTIAYRILAPALTLPDAVRIVARENNLESLLGDLALHRIDLIIADAPIPAGLNVRGFNHALGDCGISFLATPKLAKTLRKKFPGCLDTAPLLLPSAINTVHSRLLNWFEQQRIHPHIIGEFDDSALMKTFGSAGAGVFIAPTAIVADVCAQYSVTVVGKTEEVREFYYAISVERRISHPAVAAITQTAREWLQ